MAQEDPRDACDPPPKTQGNPAKRPSVAVRFERPRATVRFVDRDRQTPPGFED